MKNKTRKPIWILLLLMLQFTIFAQDDLKLVANNSRISDIDPRQYIRVYESPYSPSNKQKQKQHLLLWQHQYPDAQVDGYIHKYVDKKSLIEIHFMREDLMKNVDIFGNFYISAWLDDRPIEVGPYSEIGKDRQKIGVFSQSPKVISQSLLSFIVFTRQILDEDCDKLDNDLGLILDGVNTVKSSDPKYKPLFQNIQMLTDHLNHSIEFIDFFNNSSADTKSAFLTLLGETEIRFNYYTTYFKKIAEKFKVLKEIDVVLFKNELDNLANELRDVTNIKGGMLEVILDGLGYNTNFYKKGVDESLKSSDRFDNEENYLQFNTAVLDTLYNRMAERAAAAIFKKLVTGKIDLNKSDASEGEILKLSVMWYNLDGKDDKNNFKPHELLTVNFKITDSGWKLKPSDSALLINRLNEDFVRTDYPLSPSRFKPTGGVSLLFTYQNDHRYFTRRNNKFKHSWVSKFFKQLEPSFGVNISYLDFDTTKNLEIGVGFVMGFLRNQLFASVGYNLAVEREQPVYFGFGFSFANLISESIKK